MFEKIIEEVASRRDLQKRYPRNCLIQKRIKLFTTYDITGDSEPQKQGQCLALISKWQNRQSQQVNLKERTLFVFSSKL